MSYERGRFMPPPYFVTPRAYFENLGYAFRSDVEFAAWFAGNVDQAREWAEAAEESAAEAGRKAEAAETEKEAAAARVLDAEAWAAGTRGGEAVPEEDPAHENNAAYYAAVMQQTAQQVAGRQAVMEGRLDAQGAEIAAVRSQVASQFDFARTPAEFVDTSRAYLLVGPTVTVDDITYERGAWYYHADGAWVKGGAQVDPTFTVAGVPPDSKETGARLKSLERQETGTLKQVLSAQAAPANMQTKNDRINLEKGAINNRTGEKVVSSSGKYYRTQTDDLLLIGKIPVCVILGLEWVQWTSWSYDGDGTPTHSNTNDVYRNGKEPIFISADSRDKRFGLCFRKYGDSDATREPFTAEEIESIADALEFRAAPDVGAAMDRTAILASAVQSLGEQQFAEVELKLGGYYQFAGDNYAGGEFFSSNNTREYVCTNMLPFVGDLYIDHDDGGDYIILVWAYAVPGDFTSGTHSTATYRSLRNGVLFPLADGDKFITITIKRIDNGQITDDEMEQIASGLHVTVLNAARAQCERLQLDLSATLGVEFPVFRLGRVDINANGETNLERIVARYMSAIVACNADDAFRISGSGGGLSAGGARLWAFLDEGRNVLAMSAVNEELAGKMLIAPQGAATLVVNALPDKGYYLAKMSGAVDFGPERYTARRNHPRAVSQMLGIARSYLENLRMAYSDGYTVLDRSVPTVVGTDRWGIDCSTFVALCLMGINHAQSPYGTGVKVNPDLLIANEAFPWAIRPKDYSVSRYFPNLTLLSPDGKTDPSKVRLACQLAHWCYQRCQLVSMDNGFADVRPGDIVFWGRHNGDTGDWAKPTWFLHINHVGIVTTKELAPSTYHYNDSLGNITSEEMEWDKTRFPWKHGIIEVGGVNGAENPCREYKWLEWGQEDTENIFANNVNTVVMIARPDLGVPKED